MFSYQVSNSHVLKTHDGKVSCLFYKQLSSYPDDDDDDDDVIIH